MVDRIAAANQTYKRNKKRRCPVPRYEGCEGVLVHLSKALVQRVIDFSAVDEKGRVKVQYLPLHLQAPPGAAVKIVVASDRGITYRRDTKLEFESNRPGLRRRYALSERPLTAERIAHQECKWLPWSHWLA
jgi:hypothetical protein